METTREGLITIEEKKINKVVLDALIVYGMAISEDTATEELRGYFEAWYKDSVALMKGEEDEEDN